MVFSVENRSGDRHQLSLELNGLNGEYIISAGKNWSKKVNLNGNSMLDLPISDDQYTQIQISKK